jgi:uncharacterized iron-regulated membrane protein
MKRLLFEVHRWGGIALALFMTLWFFSGLIILYAEPGTPTRAQQLEHAEALTPNPAWLSAGAAWDQSAPERKELAFHNKANPENKPPANGAQKRPQAIVEARLVVEAEEPLWLIEDSSGRHFALSAINGHLHETSVQQALRIATHWLNKDDTTVNYLETLDKPAILRNREDLRPFHRISIEDSAGSELLISARTGEVVYASTRFERGLYWVGNWLHLFRPLELTSWAQSRVDVLTWTSFTAVLIALTGLIVGWLRWRPGFFGRKTYSEGRVHPYRAFWSRWHFWAGLAGGIVTLTFGLSGFLNNNPWKLFSPANPAKEELTRYLGGENLALAKSWQPGQLSSAQSTNLVELVWRRLGDDTVQHAYSRDNILLPQNNAAQPLSNNSLIAAAKRLAGDTPIASQTLLQEYDSYYYLRHHRDVADRPLPVLRIELGDAAATHLYIDPQDGRLLIKQDNSRRVFRWLYSALHHWDFGFLYQRPLWDAWMLSWVLMGLVLSVSSVVLGYQRIKSTLRPKKKTAVSARLVTETQAG